MTQINADLLISEGKILISKCRLFMLIVEYNVTIGLF